MKLKNFGSAVFFTQFEFDAITDFDSVKDKIKWVIDALRLDKVYLETHRSGIYIAKEKLLEAKALFEEFGVKTAGGITFTESYNKEYEQLFGTLCYSNEKTLQEIKKIVSYTSEIFDEYIIDDFYFTHCKCEKCIEKKGDRSWSAFRLELLRDVAENVVIKESKAVREDMRIILKYPNWYDHYHKAGYNLEMAQSLFDGVYTGTETRDPLYSQQNLQRYSSYFLMRYIENTRPGENLGGWFDTLDCSYNLNAVVQQANLTLFAKAKECTVYSFGAVAGEDAVFAPLLGFTYEKFDQILPKLGEPKGLMTYKPFHSSGEDFLHGYLGMLGIPLEPVPYFPADEKVLLLTETAAKDEAILDKIKAFLRAGSTLFMTKGFVRALQGKGIEDVIDVKMTENKGLVSHYGLEWKCCAYDRYYESKEPVMLTQIDFGANDTKNTISGLSHNKSYPILLESHYGKGQVYVLNIPDEYGAMAHMPTEVLDELRRLLMQDLFLDVKGNASFGLFVYDNDAFIIHSFASCSNVYEVILEAEYNKLVDLVTGEELKGELLKGKMRYEIRIQPSYYKVFKAVRS